MTYYQRYMSCDTRHAMLRYGMPRYATIHDTQQRIIYRATHKHPG